MNKIAVYGGSFDPPHKGHRLLGENLAEFCGADKVLVIPAAMSPFKESSSATSVDRLNMCQLAFDSPLFEVSDIEIQRGGKSYTVDTLKEIKKLYPGSELFLFMGDDMLLSFNRWYKYREIGDLCTLVTACRTEKLEKLSEMQSFIDENLQGIKVMLCNKVPVEISSTKVRENLKNGIVDGMVCEKVYDYIVSKELYK